MMIEGTVDVSGSKVDVSGSTVKVDTAAELANLYQIARRARDDNNAENAARYYDMILVKDPKSWEAAFYVVYFKAMQCKIMDIRAAANSVTNCLDGVLRLIPAGEQLASVSEIVLRCTTIANVLAEAAKRHYDGISYNIKSQYTQEYVDNVCAARDILYTCGNNVDSIFSSIRPIAKLAATAWERGIELHKKVFTLFKDKYHTIGLKLDGTVVAVGNNDGGQCDVSGWADIVAIAAGADHTVGLRSDGTVVAMGRNNSGRCEVSDWTDIRLPE